mgnify:CR=1 FL=1
MVTKVSSAISYAYTEEVEEKDSSFVVIFGHRVRRTSLEFFFSFYVLSFANFPEKKNVLLLFYIRFIVQIMINERGNNNGERRCRIVHSYIFFLINVLFEGRNGREREQFNIN